MGRYVKAEPLYQRSLKMRESKLGPDHSDVASSLNNLADLYEDMGQYAKAEPLTSGASRSMSPNSDRIIPGWRQA